MNILQNKLQMVDLVTQYQHIKGAIDGAIEEVINSGQYINGAAVNTFQKDLEDYLNVKHVIPCANGTDALQIALMALKLPKGAEVIVPTFNYVAAAEVVALLGYKLVFVDVEASTFTLSLDDIKRKVTPKTKAIIAVHLFGQCANLEEIVSFSKNNNIYLIEDTAQAIGAWYTFSNGTKKRAGSIGDIGTTSFFPSKNLGCMGDGGAIFTENDELAYRMRTIASHGQEKKYHYAQVGLNSRLDTLQAAILNVKLSKLDEYTKNRQSAAAYYDRALKEITSLKIPIRNRFSSHVYHQYTLRVDHNKRDLLKDFLMKHHIPSMVYYPSPLHLEKAYSFLNYQPGSFTISEKLCKEVLSLPMHTELNEEQLGFICDTIKKFFEV